VTRRLVGRIGQITEQALQRIRVGIVGLGKIALEEHVPALLANSCYELSASVSTSGQISDIPLFPSLEVMLNQGPALDAVAICTPTQAHYEAARSALQRGKHVLLEKPPCPTLEQFDELVELARGNGCTFFQTWHARETAAVDAASRWLRIRPVRRGRVVWKEDVRQWHPGQAWIWQEGGFGVLDAGINAVSILTKILPDALLVEEARIFVPSNCASPIAATVVFRTDRGAVIDAEFDFRYRGTQSRVIDLETDAGSLNLARHGAELGIDGSRISLETQQQEYAALYRRFAQLIERRESDTDKRPLELVVDIFGKAERSTIEPFQE
jgi:D-galactose 1-dehydrogenase